MTSGSTSLESLSAIERPYDDTIAASMAELVSGSMKSLFIASSVHKPLNPGIRIRGIIAQSIDYSLILCYDLRETKRRLSK